tara:strand:+ start:330 stop:794 length:465 start_codon:yes stop_codon:yes gene_type:complete
MVLSRQEINKRYSEKNKEKIKANRKRIDVICPECKETRLIRKDSKRITDLCNKCNIRKIRIEKGDILHGLSSHPLYIRWIGMKRRVLDPAKRNSYLDKNIIVCPEWSNNFLLFYEWSIINGFKADLELDRIDNNGNYCPENCRWITHKLNCLNR